MKRDSSLSWIEIDAKKFRGFFEKGNLEIGLEKREDGEKIIHGLH